MIKTSFLLSAVLELPVSGKNCNVIGIDLDIQLTVEANMEAKKPQEQKKRKQKSGLAGFLPFAVVIFTALAIGLVIIILRSKA